MITVNDRYIIAKMSVNIKMQTIMYPSVLASNKKSNKNILRICLTWILKDKVDIHTSTSIVDVSSWTYDH